MATYVDLSTLHSPTPRSKPPASWGAQIRENDAFFYASRREVCTSSTRPASTFEGLEIYETDTNLVYIYDGSGWVPMQNVSGWTSYTPTVTQSSAITKTVTNARYVKHGRLVHFQVYLALTAAGSANTIVTVSLPVNAATAHVGGPMAGTFYINDASVPQNYLGHLILGSATVCQGLISGNTAYMGQASSGFTAALASGDSVLCAGFYEADA